MKTLVSLLLILPLLTFAQDLDKHLWKERLILVIGDSYQNPKLIKQLQEFENSKEQLGKRKLLIYKITPTTFLKELRKNKISKNNNLYKKYNSSKEDFKTILIGLDGEIKMESNEFITAKKIFDRIDQMPMRRQELKTKNK